MVNKLLDRFYDGEQKKTLGYFALRKLMKNETDPIKKEGYKTQYQQWWDDHRGKVAAGITITTIAALIAAMPISKAVCNKMEQLREEKRQQALSLEAQLAKKGAIEMYEGDLSAASALFVNAEKVIPTSENFTDTIRRINKGIIYENDISNLVNEARSDGASENFSLASMKLKNAKKELVYLSKLEFDAVYDKCKKNIEMTEKEIKDLKANKLRYEKDINALNNALKERGEAAISTDNCPEDITFSYKTFKDRKKDSYKTVIQITPGAPKNKSMNGDCYGVVKYLAGIVNEDVKQIISNVRSMKAGAKLVIEERDENDDVFKYDSLVIDKYGEKIGARKQGMTLNENQTGEYNWFIKQKNGNQ